jgi:hypothetical protein
MDKDHLFVLSHMLIFGELFFITVEGLQKNDDTVKELLVDVYKNVSFN